MIGCAKCNFKVKFFRKNQKEVTIIRNLLPLCFIGFVLLVEKSMLIG